MDDAKQPGGRRGERFTDDHGETEAIEHGVDSLGTPAAGAGAGAHDPAAQAVPAGAAPRTPDPATPPPVHFTSDAGEQVGIEQGVQLTEEGAQAARPGGGETF